MIKKLTHSMSSMLKVRSRMRGRRAFADRRRATRSAVRLPLRISVIDSNRKSQTTHKPIDAYTRELSTIGLSFVLSEAQVHEYDFMKRDRGLQITLSLPSRDIEIFASVASTSRFYINEAQQWYVVGVQITKLSEEDRRALQSHLSNLSNPDEVVFEDLAYLK